MGGREQTPNLQSGPNGTIGGGRQDRDSDGLGALCYPKDGTTLPLVKWA